MIRLFSKSNALVVATVALMVVAWSLPDPAEARRGGGGGHRGGGGGGGGHRSVKGRTHTNVNRGGSRNKSVNRKNVNVNKNVNVDVNRRGGYYGRGYNPVGTAVAVAATAVVVGSIVNSVPSNCTTVVSNNISYRQCGNDWYEPRYSGGSTSYVVVNSPY
jgi:hypothetical protein